MEIKDCVLSHVVVNRGHIFRHHEFSCLFHTIGFNTWTLHGFFLYLLNACLCEIKCMYVCFIYMWKKMLAAIQAYQIIALFIKRTNVCLYHIYLFIFFCNIGSISASLYRFGNESKLLGFFFHTVNECHL